METEHDEAFDAVAAVREVVLRAYPQVVPELVGGESMAALLASVEPAAAAYQRVAAGVAAGLAEAAGGAGDGGAGAAVGVTASAGSPATALVAPVVPAGSAAAVALDVERLPPVEKIRRALAAGMGVVAR